MCVARVALDQILAKMHRDSNEIQRCCRRSPSAPLGDSGSPRAEKPPPRRRFALDRNESVRFIVPVEGRARGGVGIAGDPAVRFEVWLPRPEPKPKSELARRPNESARLRAAPIGVEGVTGCRDCDCAARVDGLAYWSTCADALSPPSRAPSARKANPATFGAAESRPMTPVVGLRSVDLSAAACEERKRFIAALLVSVYASVRPSRRTIPPMRCGGELS